LNEKIVPAKTGCTLLVGQTILHSRYDPVLEAEKYAVSLDLKPCRYFILIEPGLGYLAAALGKLYPSSQIISLHCSSFFQESNLSHNDPKVPGVQGGINRESFADLSWTPGSAKGLEDFLEGLIYDTDASQIKLIEWKPSINAYGRACLDLAARTVECIRRISAGRKTIQNFGRRWFRNALRNLELLEKPSQLLSGSAPVLVCAAGPSLENSLDDVQEWKQSPAPPFLIAVSSAVSALLYRRIVPDIVITTDGGPWALFHLTEGYRREKSPALAAALTSALPSQTAQALSLFLCDGSLWQELLLRTAGVPFLVFPQRGTVSASALDLAFFASTGPVYISGLDLAHRDLLTHARPHAFEIMLELSAGRRDPLHSKIFEREETIRRSGSHGIYAAWFKSNLHSFPRPIHTLGPSCLGITQKKPFLNEGELPRITAQAAKPAPGKKQLLAVLLDALDNPLTAEQIGKELRELILPRDLGGSGDYSDTVKRALLEMYDG